MPKAITGNLVLAHYEDEILIGTYHIVLGFRPLIRFDSLESLRTFIDELEEYYKEKHPEIPDVYLRAFEEEVNDNINPTRD